MSELDPFFPCISPESVDPHLVSIPFQIEELSRHVHQCRESYPKRVDKGRMAKYDADELIDAFETIHVDLRHQEAVRVWYESDDSGDLWREAQRLRKLLDHMLERFQWSFLVAIMQREIGLRRRYYPQWVRAGTLDPLQARHRLERLEAVHFHWWQGMNHFMPPELFSKRAAIGASDGPEREAFRVACRVQRARFDPASTRGEYAATPSTPPAAEEPQLALV